MIGCDIVQISRFERLINKYGNRFLVKFLTQKEINLAKTPASVAGFWAAKEACSKALGTGICADCSFFDFEIYKDTRNAPKLKISEILRRRFNIKANSVSISHDGGFAIAVVALVS